jgi:hypothetical protein
VRFLSDRKKLEALNAGIKDVAGQFHMGKLSLFNFNDDVLFLTNNGTEGYRIKMMRYPPPGRKPLQIKKSRQPDAFLGHRGTKIIIMNPRLDNASAFHDELWEFLLKPFSS